MAGSHASARVHPRASLRMASVDDLPLRVGSSRHQYITNHNEYPRGEYRQANFRAREEPDAATQHLRESGITASRTNEAPLCQKRARKRQIGRNIKCDNGVCPNEYYSFATRRYACPPADAKLAFSGTPTDYPARAIHANAHLLCGFQTQGVSSAFAPTHPDHAQRCHLTSGAAARCVVAKNGSTHSAGLRRNRLHEIRRRARRSDKPLF